MSLSPSLVISANSFMPTSKLSSLSSEREGRAPGEAQLAPDHEIPSASLAPAVSLEVVWYAVFARRAQFRV